MKKLLATICAGAVLGLMASCDDAPGKAKAYNQGINIIPTPVSLTQNEGNFKLNKNTKIYASTPEAKTVAEFFAAKMNTATGYQIATADKETSDGISLVIDGSLDVNDEGYTLDVAYSLYRGTNLSIHILIDGNFLLRLQPFPKLNIINIKICCS